jgi:hypothetical protein
MPRVRHEKEMAERLALQEKIEAEATRRHEKEMAEAERRQKAEAEERRREREFLANQRPQQDQVTAAIQAQSRAIEKALERMKNNDNEGSRRDLLSEVKRMKEIRTMLGLEDETSTPTEPEIDPTVATIAALLKEAGPVAEPVLKGVMERWIRGVERDERREIREEQRARKGGQLEGPDGSLTPAARAKLASGIEIEIPDDHVMLVDGSACIPLATYPAHVARRTRAQLEAQLQSQYQAVQSSQMSQPTSSQPDWNAASPPAFDAPSPLDPAPMFNDAPPREFHERQEPAQLPLALVAAP